MNFLEFLTRDLRMDFFVREAWRSVVEGLADFVQVVHSYVINEYTKLTYIWTWSSFLGLLLLNTLFTSSLSILSMD